MKSYLARLADRAAASAPEPAVAAPAVDPFENTAPFELDVQPPLPFVANPPSAAFESSPHPSASPEHTRMMEPPPSLHEPAVVEHSAFVEERYISPVIREVTERVIEKTSPPEPVVETKSITLKPELPREPARPKSPEELLQQADEFMGAVLGRPVAPPIQTIEKTVEPRASEPRQASPPEPAPRLLPQQKLAMPEPAAPDPVEPEGPSLVIGNLRVHVMSPPPPQMQRTPPARPARVAPARRASSSTLRAPSSLAFGLGQR